MGLFDKVKEPVFLKEDSDAHENLTKLQELLNKITDVNVKQQIEQDMKVLSYGIAGEGQIAFELKNSHMPMFILHDLYLEDGELTAQIDYMVITRKDIFIIECKNLVGNIEINSSGDFIRTLEFNGKYKKEGIYSPITQNIRHLELIKQIRAKTKGFISKAIFENSFNSTYHSVVVLANPKTILNAKYAKKEIKDQVIRADQLIAYIKRANSAHSLMESNISDKEMEELAAFFLRINKKNPKDYCEKYRLLLSENDFNNKGNIAEQSINNSLINRVKNKNGEITDNNVKTPQQTSVMGNSAVSNNTASPEELLIKDLKAFRLTRSREENIKPYYIFNDNQMMEIISKRPKNKYELKNVSGFADAKCSKYGEEIVSILKKHQSINQTT